jgi:Uncharacterized conserved protein
MKIGIVGAGRVGCAFTRALYKKGAEISGIYNRTTEVAALFDLKLKRLFLSDLRQAVKNADLVILAVPDSVISAVSNSIAEQCDARNKVYLHCSGAMTSDILEPLKLAGAYIGSLHPIQTFADRENGWRSMYGIWFGYEGSSEASLKALEIVKLLDGSMLQINKEAKPLYHAAACILSNYMVTLSYVSGMLLQNAGIGKDEGLKAFMPLLYNTIVNLDKYGAENALTGPIARGDTITVTSHIASLDKLDKNISDFYRNIGLLTAELAYKKGSIDNRKYDDMIDVLQFGSKSGGCREG